MYFISLELSLCWDPVVYSSVSMRTAVGNLIDTCTTPVFDDTGSVRRSRGGGVGDMEEELEFEMEVIKWSKGEGREGGNIYCTLCKREGKRREEINVKDLCTCPYSLSLSLSCS